MAEARQTRRELAIGILIADLFLFAAGVWFVPEKLAYFSGVLLGAVIAELYLRHMYHCLDIALDLEPKAAETYARRKSVQRLIMMGLAVSLAGVLPQYFHVVGACLGVLGLKFSAFLQPLIHKYIFKL